MSFLRDFVDGATAEYEAMSPEQRRATNIVAVVNVVGSIGTICWMIHDRRKAKERRARREEFHRRLSERLDQDMARIRERNQRLAEQNRKIMQDIVDRALHPTEEDLNDFRMKLDDPNHVWEL